MGDRLHNEVPRLHDCQLRLPKSIADPAARLAKEDGESLTPWIVSAVAQKICAALTAEDFPKTHSGTSKPGDLTKFLDSAPYAPSAQEDAIPDLDKGVRIRMRFADDPPQATQAACRDWPKRNIVGHDLD